MVLASGRIRRTAGIALPILVLSISLVGCSSTTGDFEPFTVVEKPPDAEPEPQPEKTAPAPIDGAEPGTRVVILGTGTPNPDPDRMGSAIAVIAAGRPYLVDCGAGIVRRAAAARAAGIEALAMPNLSRLFLTHLHSDHTLGYADLILTPWVLEREDPLQVYGPPGTRAMTDHLLAAYAEDIDMRLHGSQPQNASGIRVEVHEISPGPVYEDANVTVTALAVQHGQWDRAYGYRFETADRTIVISGDTAPTEAVVEACNGCDVLIHEVYAEVGWKRRTPDWQTYHAAFHTSGIELGELASRAKPKLLVLYHQLLWMGATEDELLSEIRQNFDGEVVSAKDLDVY